MAVTPRQRIETLFGAIYSGDLAVVLSCLHPDIVVNEADTLPYGGVFRRHDGFLRLQRIMTSLMDIRIVSHRLIVDGERVVGHVQVAFTVKAGKRSVTMPVVEIYDFRDALISSIDVYYKDSGAMNALLGSRAADP